MITTLSVVDDSAGGPGSNTAAIIVGLAVALMALAGICCALVYKIKMEKLRLMYDQQVSLGIVRVKYTLGHASAHL